MRALQSTKVFLVRVARWPARAWQWKDCAKQKGDSLSFCLAEHRTPLRRSAIVKDEKLQKGKEVNIARSASLIDGVIVQPNQTFSYHRLVGPPIRSRKFVEGLELRSGQEATGVGGGCCSVSNLLFLLALMSGQEIVERHRHGLDLFPDHGRTVPFGCGATIFFPYADLKFTNPHPFPVRVSLSIIDGFLVGQIQAAEDPGWRIRLVERDHRFHREEGSWVRENRICREISDLHGQIVREEEVIRNKGRCLYDPEAVEA